MRYFFALNMKKTDGKLFEFLYYIEKQGWVNYTRNPVGKLAVNELIAGKPCWVPPTLPSIEKQKTLILADWSMPAWTSEKTAQVKKVLSELRSQGFSIYIFCNGQVSPLQQDDLLRLSENRLDFSTAKDVCKAALAQHTLTVDQIQVIDDYIINQILSDDERLQPRVLRTSEMPYLSTKELDQLVKMINASKPPLSQIIHDDFSQKSNDTVTRLKEKWPGVDVDIQYTEANFTDIKTLEDTDNIKIGEFILDKPKLQKLKSVIMSESTTNEVKCFVLKQVPNLKKINLWGCRNLGEIDFSGIHLEQLEEIDVSKSDMTSRQLSSILTQTKNIKKIHLRYKILDGIDFSCMNLKQLEEIDVSCSNITSSQIQSILMQAKNIKKINLNYFKQLGEIDFSDIKLEHIKEIDLSNSNITSSELNSILIQSKKLKKINLSKCEDLGEIDFFGIYLLDQLEEIDVSHSNITSSQLTSILSQTNNIKKMYLNRCVNLGEIDFSGIHLEQLEAIEVSLNNITSIQLMSILSKTKNLKKFTLFGNLIEIDYSGIHLEHLEEIDFNYSPITSSQLTSILSQTKNIKKIKLNGYRNLGESDFHGIHLEKLEEMDVSGSSIITLSEITCILNQTKNLKKMNLSYCKQLNESHFSAIYLDQLEELDVSFSTISSTQLSSILNQAKNLKKINLNGCKNLGKIDFIGVHLEQLEEMDAAHDSQITSSQITSILNQSKHLKKINLQGCKNLGQIDFYEINLEQLEEIDFDTSDVSTKYLSYILETASKLSVNSKKHIETTIDRRRMRSSQSISTDSKSTTSVSSVEPLPPSTAMNPIHDPSKMKSTKPNATHTPYDFKNTQQNKNQGMIIGKICHYWIKNNIHLELVPRVQDGICYALSHYFLKLTTSSWDTFIEEALKWNGEDTLSPTLQQHFDELALLIKNVPFEPRATRQYIGDDLKSFLKTQTTACILANPWHAITIRPIEQDMWEIYDPNYVTGYLTVNSTNLLDQLQRSLGTLVCVDSNESYRCIINNPNDFIAHGGLLALCRCENIDAILPQLPTVYSKEALEGIFLRDNSGKPAWVLGLQSPHESIRRLTTQLKNQFEDINPDCSSQALTESLDALTPFQKHECITTIIQTGAPDAVETADTGVATDTRTSLHALTAANEKLFALIRASAQKEQYKKALKTWDTTVESVPNVFAYCQRCLNSDVQNRLIQLDSTTQLDQLRLQLQDTAGHLSRPVFYVDKPEDLVCQAAWVERRLDDTGEVRKGPGGPLYDFLMANKNKAPLLLVNYEQFNADDLVRLNGLLDKTPLADGIRLPDKTQIIGLMNRNKPDCYQGSDFYSRFHCNERCPLTHEQLHSKPMKTVTSISPDLSDTSLINLYHAPDWEERLLGRWALDGNDLTFQEGALLKAIKAGKPIEIRHAPWGDKKFERFLKQLMNGGIRHGFRNIELPENIPLIRPKTEFYTWNPIPTIDLTTAPDTNSKILNASSLGDFFGRYELKDDQLQRRPGWIEEAKQGNQVLSIHITRTLSDDAWAMLLDECNTSNVKLRLYPAAGVELPKAFQYAIKKPTLNEGLPEGVSSDSIVTSSDIDTTVALLLKKQDSAIIIDVSECTPADLWVKLDGRLNQETLHFEFNRSDGALITALRENQTVILKGQFSPELIDTLAAVLEERKKTPAAGQLVLVTDDQSCSEFFSNRYVHQASLADKLSCLPFDGHITEQLKSYLEHEPLCMLYARALFLKTHPEKTNSDEAWIGMHSIPNGIETPMSVPDISQCAAITDEYVKARIQTINAVLNSAPYVFISGLSGVGKSTFVETEFCQENDTLYLTEDRIALWASDLSDKRKILFIDEANLSHRQWSEFEGLFHTPPSILIDGKRYPLTENHKIIFSGNPVQYGDERQLAPLFQRHGNAVLFTPLPPAFIVEKILKPVFTDSASNLEQIINPILEIYRFVCDCSSTEVLISPRELQMMALLTQSRAKAHPEEDIIAIVEQCRYHLAKNLVPKAKKQDFEQQFKPKQTEKMKPVLEQKTSHFLVTPSRQLLSEQLNDLLDLRQWRLEGQRSLNAQQKAGGLGGIIIEGEPGIGKSELVIAELRNRNYHEMKGWSKPATHENIFYIMPVSMSLSEKEDLLIKAFKEGALVIIDEVNSSPMMERLLNDLLMGKNPKGNPDELIKPGFMVIGTQNPVTLAGRRMASTALQRRLIMSILPEYTPNEMITILPAKGVDAIDAEAMIDAYEENRAYAIRQQLSPLPNFRDLMHLAESDVKSKAHHQRPIVDENTKDAPASVKHENGPEIRMYGMFTPPKKFVARKPHQTKFVGEIIEEKKIKTVQPSAEPLSKIINQFKTTLNNKYADLKKTPQWYNHITVDWKKNMSEMFVRLDNGLTSYNKKNNPESLEALKENITNIVRDAFIATQDLPDRSWTTWFKEAFPNFFENLKSGFSAVHTTIDSEREKEAVKIIKESFIQEIDNVMSSNQPRPAEKSAPR